MRRILHSSATVVAVNWVNWELKSCGMEREPADALSLVPVSVLSVGAESGSMAGVESARVAGMLLGRILLL